VLVFDLLKGFASKTRAALRSVCVPAAPACRPRVEIERQRRALESPDGPQVERHWGGYELFKEVHGEGDGGFCGALVGTLTSEAGREMPFWTKLRAYHSPDDRIEFSQRAAKWSQLAVAALDFYR
jgi:hypothetical protein